jgi:hypothetical protein
VSMDPNEFNGAGTNGGTFQPMARQFLPDAGGQFPPTPTPFGAGGAPGMLQPGMAPGPGMPGDLGAGDQDPLEEPKIELYPALVDYNVPLSEQQLDDLGRELIAEVEKYYQDVGKRLESCETWRADCEMMQADGDGPWPDSARVRAPLTENAVRGHAVKLNQTIIHAVPPFVCEAKSEEAIDAAPLIEEALAAQLEEANWKRIANEVHAELPLVGNVFLLTTYEQEIARQPRHQLDFDEHAYADYLQQGMDPAQAMQEAVRKDRDGKAKVTLAWQNVLKSSGVRFRVVPFEDGVIFPATIRDPDEARGIGHRLTLRGADLKVGVKRGQYLKAPVEDLLERSSDGIPDDRLVKLDFSGISGDAGGASLGESSPLNRDYLCYELYYQMDANGDDELEWVVVTVHESGKVLRCQYLPYHHGRAPITMFRYFTRSRELFGMGVAEKIATIQDAATTVLCQLIDHADLSLNVFGNIIYEKNSGFKPENFEWAMGTPIPVENVDGVKFLTPPQMVPEHYQLYQLLKDIADLTTSTSNPSLGAMTDTQKTLGEVQIVSSASNMQFEENAALVSLDWAKVWDQVRWLVGQYGTGGQVKFRKTAQPQVTVQGEDGAMVPGAELWGQTVPAPGGAVFDSIPSHMMLAEVDLVPAGLKQLADMQSRVQQASLVQATLLQHPLVGQSVDAQVVMLDEYLQALRYPQRKKLIEIIDQVAAQVKQQQMLQQMLQQAMMGAAPGGAPAPGPSQRPEDQGPQGAPAGFPGGGPATGPNGIPMPPQPGGQRT